MLLIILAVFIQFVIAGEDGKLKDFEDELNKPIEHNNNNQNEEDDNYDEDEDDPFDNLFWSIVYETFIGSNCSYNSIRIQPYIYYNDFSGRYADDGNSFDAEIDIKYIYNSNDLDGISLSGSIFFLRMMNLKFNYQKLSEELDNGNDEMEYYELFLDYYRARFHNFNWFWGIGVKGLQRNNSYLGMGLNTGFEIYPVKPVSLEIAANIGWLNEHPVSKIITDINIHYWRIKFAIGYQRLMTGNAKINSINIGIGINY